MLTNFSRKIVPVIRRIGQSGTVKDASMQLCPRHPFPEAPLPETCCGSGCYNCVWIQYADSVTRYFDEHPQLERIKERWELITHLLAQNVTDVNLRAYLQMEMKSKFFHK